MSFPVFSTDNCVMPAVFGDGLCCAVDEGPLLLFTAEVGVGTGCSVHSCPPLLTLETFASDATEETSALDEDRESESVEAFVVVHSTVA